MSDVSLYHGDCLELLKDVPSKSVNMVLCDLPYGTTRNKWDSCINLDALWIEYKRVLAEGGAVALFAQMPFVATLYNSNPKWFRYEYIWVKSRPTGFLNANRMPLKAHEQILIFYPKLPTYNKQRRLGFKNYARLSPKNHCSNYGKFHGVHKVVTDGTRDPIDVLNFKIECGKHPTQKPVLLLEWLIKTYTNAGETVLDNTMGSGSTGVACVNTGRNFIGMELNAEYFATAQARIKEAQGALICYWYHHFIHHA